MSLIDSLTAERPPLREAEGGAIRVGNTRIALNLVVNAYKEGLTAEEIVSEWDTLDLADVHAVICYYLRHRTDVEAYLLRVEQEADNVKQEIEARWPRTGVRERLLGRREHPNDEA